MWRLALVIAVLLVYGLVVPNVGAERATPTAMGSPAPQDEATLQSLVIVAFAPGAEPTGPTILGFPSAYIDLQPGESVVLVLGGRDFESCGLIGFACFTPVPVPAKWSVSPSEEAAIDAGTGRLTIAPGAANGSVIAVRADILGGQRRVETEVNVYTPAGNPFVGYWMEEAQLACESEAVIPPAQPVEELIFSADGTYRLTWTPFESYVDYWGTYAFALERGALDMTVTDGNTIPSDFDGEGRFALDEAGRLVLTDIWLGTSRSAGAAATPGASGAPLPCGQRFVRLS